MMTNLALEIYGNANVIKVGISEESVMEEKPKEGFDFIGGLGFPN